MTSDYKRTNYVQRNEEKSCSCPGCPKLRHFTSRYCINHRRRSRIYGSPLGKPTKHEAAAYEVVAAELLAQHRDVRQLAAAVKAMDRIINIHRFTSDLTTSWVNRLRGHPEVTPERLLARLIAVYLLRENRPKAFDSDQHFLYECASAVLRTIALPSYKSEGGTRRYARVPATALKALGHVLMRTYGVFLVHLTTWIRSQEEHQRELQVAINTPFKQDAT